MDGLKLEKWKKNFDAEVRNVEIEFDAFFKNKRLNEYYTLHFNESDELSLEVSNKLPGEIKERLIKLLPATKPEDSI